jgi:hypothetical protein
MSRRRSPISGLIEELEDLARQQLDERDDPDDVCRRRRRRMGQVIAALSNDRDWSEIAAHLKLPSEAEARELWGWAVRERWGTSHLRRGGGPIDVHAYVVIVWHRAADQTDVRVAVADESGRLISPGLGWVERHCWVDVKAGCLNELWELLTHKEGVMIPLLDDLNAFQLERVVRTRRAIASALQVADHPDAWRPRSKEALWNPSPEHAGALIEALRDVYGHEVARIQAGMLGIRYKAPSDDGRRAN